MGTFKLLEIGVVLCSLETKEFPLQIPLFMYPEIPFLQSDGKNAYIFHV